MKRFFQYALRTTDADGARAFYAAVLGNGNAEIYPLHEQALARGARPHWLGHLDVGEVDPAAAAFAARGATLFGKWTNPQGLEAAIFRDAGGALVSLAKPPPASSAGRTDNPPPEVAWHELNTVDVKRAIANYGELFGWQFKEPVQLDLPGVFHPFAWEAGGAAVGSMSDIAERQGVHPHWLFFFRVRSLETALEAVRAGGGLGLPPLVLGSGARVAVCDDPQGAAFGLLEERRP